MIFARIGNGPCYHHWTEIFAGVPLKVEMRGIAIDSEIISTLCNSSGSNFNQRRTYPKIDEAEEFLLQRDDVLSSLQQKQKNTQVAIQKNLLKLLENLVIFFSFLKNEL